MLIAAAVLVVGSFGVFAEFFKIGCACRPNYDSGGGSGAIVVSLPTEHSFYSRMRIVWQRTTINQSLERIRSPRETGGDYTCFQRYHVQSVPENERRIGHFAVASIAADMSEDVFRSVMEHLDATDRFSLAEVSQRIGKIATRWDDVDSILFDDNRVVIAGDHFKHEIALDSRTNLTEVLQSVFTLCPSSRRLWIQKKLNENDVNQLKSKANKLHRLYISTENFDTKVPVQWSETTFNRLRSLNILQRADQPLRNTCRIGNHDLHRFLSPSLRKVCLTGLLLTEELVKKLQSLTHLTTLDLIGCVMDSNAAAKCVTGFGEMENLENLSLPPSMFSFSRKESNKDIKFTFRSHKIHKLTVYMEFYDKDWFWTQMEQLMPATLEGLVLFGNYHKLKMDARLKSWKKFQILFGPPACHVVHPVWSQGECSLISHLVRHAPYSGNEFQQNTISPWRVDEASLLPPATIERQIPPQLRVNNGRRRAAPIHRRLPPRQPGRRVSRVNIMVPPQGPAIMDSTLDSNSDRSPATTGREAITPPNMLTARSVASSIEDEHEPAQGEIVPLQREEVDAMTDIVMAVFTQNLARLNGAEGSAAAASQGNAAPAPTSAPGTSSNVPPIAAGQNSAASSQTNGVPNSTTNENGN